MRLDIEERTGHHEDLLKLQRLGGAILFAFVDEHESSSFWRIRNALNLTDCEYHTTVTPVKQPRTHGRIHSRLWSEDITYLEKRGYRILSPLEAAKEYGVSNIPYEVRRELEFYPPDDMQGVLEEFKSYKRFEIVGRNPTLALNHWDEFNNSEQRVILSHLKRQADKFPLIFDEDFAELIKEKASQEQLKKAGIPPDELDGPFVFESAINEPPC